MSRPPREPVSVVLPTTEWTPACSDVAAQLRPGDELLVACDTPADPVAGRTRPDGVSVYVAGEPEGCSGKANAVACAVERASNDRFVWTDADFRRDDDWLDRLVAAGETHGPATAIPFFYGGGWWTLLEAWAAVFSTLSLYLGVGVWGGNAWGGGVTFTRADVDVDALVADLRTVLSDDALLSDHLGAVHPIRSMVTPVAVSGGLRAVVHRSLRFNRLTHVHEGMTGALVALTVATAVAALTVPWSAVAVTAFAAGVYRLVGVRRRTFLLAFPGLFLTPLVLGAAVVCPVFEWAGRRYRLDGPRDVTVVDASAR